MEKVIGIAGAVIATEHFFTFALPSLPTVKTLYRDKPDDIKRAYFIASGLSLATGVFISVGIKSWLPFLVTLFLVLIFGYLYEQALKGKIGGTIWAD